MTKPPTQFDRGVWLQVAARRDRAKTVLPPPDAGSSDCVERYPTMSEDFVQLVRFNSAGKPQLIVSVPANEDLAPFERWMNSWGRRRDRKTLRIV